MRRGRGGGRSSRTPEEGARVGPHSLGVLRSRTDEGATLGTWTGSEGGGACPKGRDAGGSTGPGAVGDGQGRSGGGAEWTEYELHLLPLLLH